MLRWEGGGGKNCLKLYDAIYGRFLISLPIFLSQCSRSQDCWPNSFRYSAEGRLCQPSAQVQFFCKIAINQKERMTCSHHSLKIRTGVNFTNVLRGAFTYVSCVCSFLCLRFIGLYFTGVSLPVQKLHVERWWNWAQVGLVIRLFVRYVPLFWTSNTEFVEKGTCWVNWLTHEKTKNWNEVLPMLLNQTLPLLINLTFIALTMPEVIAYENRLWQPT